MKVPFRILVLALLLIQLASLDAIAMERVPSPTSPRESLRHIVVEPRLTVELAAHEPSVIDPVAIRFDEDGRMWVVEMRDYPTVSTPGNLARSRISVLTDRDHDGFFETATVFADDLPYATGLQPWRGGVFVTMSGQVTYMKDTTGDGRADMVETWYTGFAEKNTQLRASHPWLALDNHIYIANGLRGGMIVDAFPDSTASPVSISGMDFRFDPLTRQFEAVSGVGQFGLTFDDHGNRFVCSNRNPAIHIVLEDRFLKKNPLVAVAAVSTDVAKAGAESRIFPIGRSWSTSHLHAGQFTAACGVKIYRGDALPEDYYGNLFVCEPTGHLVHREIVVPDGITFTSVPGVDGTAFFASRDEWCSPVSLEVGPDGALYVVDMYRAVIEHPEWMPAELRQRPDLTDGNDRGRIYRIIPRGFGRPESVQLSTTPSASLVNLLAHRNAWWRETASRLILERQEKALAPALLQVALSHQSYLARIHALRLLEGLGVLSEEVLLRLLQASQPRVVEQAILASETRILESEELHHRIAGLASHEDPRVRFQALLVAMPLVSVLDFPADHWELVAVLIAAGNRGGSVLADLLNSPERLHANLSDPKEFVANLARLAAASNDPAEQSIALNALVRSNDFRNAGLASYLAEVARSGTAVDALSMNESTRNALEQVLHDARETALDTNQPEQARLESIDVLASVDAEALAPLALHDPHPAIRLRVIVKLAKNRTEAGPWRKLAEQFSRETPVIQGAILDGLFTAADRLPYLLDALAAGHIRPAELGLQKTTLLLNHRDTSIQQQARQFLTNTVPTNREQALHDYRVVLSMDADPRRGRGVFEKQCAACHRINDVGVPFAPDISDSREKSIEQLLTDIIQPNRAIDANFFSYTVVTVDGRVHNGVLAAETSTSVTLKQAEGKEVTLRRDEIDELRSDGVSFMPDGLEENISPQDMADLIAFIKHWRYLEEGQSPSATAP